MAGRPNRRPRSEVPPRDVSALDAEGRPKRVGPGFSGGHEIDAFWDMDESDVRVWRDRVRRKQAQVEKLKRERAELKQGLRLRTEEAYQEGLLANAPALLEIDRKLAAITTRLLEGDLEGDDLRLLKALLPELSKQRDRLYGKTRARVESSSVSASVDINELLRQKQGVLGAGDPGDAVDAEVLEEEVLEDG